MTVQIDKAENGYILKMGGKTYIADSFGDAMYKCALAFDEKEIVQMARDGSESETSGNKDAEIIRAHNLSRRKPGRPRKAKEAQ